MKKWIKIVCWLLFALAVFLLFARVKKSQEKVVMDQPNIVIHVSGENAFLTENELRTRLERKGLIYKHQTYKRLKINEVEKSLRAMSEVKSAKVFSEIGSRWTIEVEIRKPIARIFNNYGESFYLDELGFTMAQSELYTARVVVVTGDIPDRMNSESVPIIINNETLKTNRKLDDLFRICQYVCDDQLFQALIGQIHRRSNGDFVLIPQVGEHKIIFGSALSEEEVHDKFEKLKVFYKEAIVYEGWNKYDEISLKYDKQIVCKKKEYYE
jgi:cell division protein FtsQ